VFLFNFIKKIFYELRATIDVTHVIRYVTCFAKRTRRCQRMRARAPATIGEKKHSVRTQIGDNVRALSDFPSHNVDRIRSRGAASAAGIANNYPPKQTAPLSWNGEGAMQFFAEHLSQRTCPPPFNSRRSGSPSLPTCYSHTAPTLTGLRHFVNFTNSYLLVFVASSAPSTVTHLFTLWFTS